jgi:hypothetical protein
MVSRGSKTDGTATELERLVATAYWAGQSDGRGDERNNLKKRVENFIFGRYCNVQNSVIESISPCVERRATEGLFRERDELLGFDFDISK